MVSESILGSNGLKIGRAEILALFNKSTHLSMELVQRMTIGGFKLLTMSSKVKCLENRLHLTGGLKLFILIF